MDHKLSTCWQLRAILWMSIRVLLLRLVGFDTKSLAEETRMDNPWL